MVHEWPSGTEDKSVFIAGPGFGVDVGFKHMNVDGELSGQLA